MIADATGTRRLLSPVDSLARHLVDAGGSSSRIVRKKSAGKGRFPALTRHRLPFARPNRQGGAWLYEIVPGTTISDSTTPNSPISIRLRLDTPSGHARAWGDRQVSNEMGEFHLRVPYATVGALASGFIPTGPYQMRTERGQFEIDVTEDSIQTASLPSRLHQSSPRIRMAKND